LASIAGEAFADAIVRVREGHARVVLGYDGVYGDLVLSDEIEKIGRIRPRSVQQMNLGDLT
jgi:hypothetical protein